MVFWKDFVVGYRFVLGVVWLMGGEKGFVFMVVFIVIMRVFGRVYYVVVVIVVLVFWLGGGVFKFVLLLYGVIFVLVYKCI